MDKLEIDRIRKTITAKLKNGAMLTVLKGRNQRITVPVVIESAHPNVFTVKVEDAGTAEWTSMPRRLSFTYIDVLTNSVELSFEA
ncbi:MAG: Veg family protein [Clostridiales bacterium]|jgi:uncharacterized protein Veg|nr:Veg family protein [Clostridiales bacterium]